MPIDILDPVYVAVTAEGKRENKSNEDVYAALLATIQAVEDKFYP